MAVAKNVVHPFITKEFLKGDLELWGCFKDVSELSYSCLRLFASVSSVVEELLSCCSELSVMLWMRHRG